jgi:uncharacterized protein (TIGR02217 family)
MASFIDIYMPDEVPGYPCVAAPKTSTTIARSDSGDEQSNRNRVNPLHTFRLPNAVRDHDVLDGLMNHWAVTNGPFKSFPFRNPLDFASVSLTAANVEPVISGTDQVIGTGNGAKTQFQLVKTYTRGAYSHVRPIRLPIVATVVVKINGVDPSMGWSVSREGGIVTFDSAPAGSTTITAGFYFDVPVRFESDDALEAIVFSYQTSSFADLVLMEVPLC